MEWRGRSAVVELESVDDLTREEIMLIFERGLLSCSSSALCTLAVVEVTASELSLCVSILTDRKKGSKIGRGARGPSVNKPKLLLYRGNPTLR